MAITVDEIMNRELFSLRPKDHADEALGYLVALEITGAPVLDKKGAPVGVVSMRDLLGRAENTPVELVMTKPALSVRLGASIEEAARLIGETNFHRLIVVDEGGRAVGVVSSLDVIRGLVGLPAQHPPPFPHYDADTDLVWTDDLPLDMDRIEAAPDSPGVFAIIRGGAGKRETVAWAEGSRNVRKRLIDLIENGAEGTLGQVLKEKELRYRAARCFGPVGQEQALAVLARRSVPNPG
jgi:CBS domain-containing protein